MYGDCTFACNLYVLDASVVLFKISRTANNVYLVYITEISALIKTGLYNSVFSEV
jgi:hypothetical protein